MQEKDVNTIIGRNIRIRRALKGHTQETLGRQLGVSFQQVQKYERGVNSVCPAKLLHLSEIFECGVEELFRDPALPTECGEPMPTPSRRTLRLIQSFERIPSKSLQKQIGDLIHVLAEQQAGPEEQ